MWIESQNGVIAVNTDCLCDMYVGEGVSLSAAVLCTTAAGEAHVLGEYWTIDLAKAARGCILDAVRRGETVYTVPGEKAGQAGQAGRKLYSIREEA